jgi:alpha-tubulin suppressor-like RCC1 family protein
MALTISGFTITGNLNAVHIIPPPPPEFYLWGWGPNSAGQLGLGNTSSYSSPKQVGALTTWLSISMGSNHGAAIKTDGTMWSWGNNYKGRLGLGNITNYSSPKQIGALTTWLKISAGHYHNLAIKTDGTMWAWGFNESNDAAALGLGDISNRSSPTQIGSLTTWAQVSAGRSLHSAAIKTDGTLWAWGGNYAGRLGLGDPGTVHRSSPTQVGALTTWSQTSAGERHRIALQTNGTMWAWGQNSYSQLGDSTTTDRSSPVQVGSGYNSISSGAKHNLAITTDGYLRAWGHNQYGKLGVGDTNINRQNPTGIGALTNWSRISAGADHSLALNSDGTMWSWGSGGNGRLGLGNTTNYSSPKQVGALTTWSIISAGNSSMAIIEE